MSSAPSCHACVCLSLPSLLQRGLLLSEAETSHLQPLTCEEVAALW